MAKDAFYFLIPLLAGAAAAFWLGWNLAVGLLMGLSAFVAFFFRDPDRTVPGGSGVIVAPADGRIVRIETTPKGVELSIFLSLFNVHINRAPVEGEVTDVIYKEGVFHAAFSDVASSENEQNTLTIRNTDFEVSCSQVAGLVARRIVCWKQKGDSVARGERIGLIRFGSRADLILPAHVQLQVGLGDRVRGGSSTIGIIELRGTGAVHGVHAQARS